MNLLCRYISHSIILLSVSTVVQSYELTGRHTYFVMAITAACALVLLLSLAALYKNLAPISQHREENVLVNATSKLSLAVMEHTFPGIV